MDKNIEAFHNSDRTVASANNVEQVDNEIVTNQLQPPLLQFNKEESEKEQTTSAEKEQLKTTSEDGNSIQSSISAAYLQLKTFHSASLTPPPLQFVKPEKDEEIQEVKTPENTNESEINEPEANIELNKSALQFKSEPLVSLPPPILQFKTEAESEEETEEPSAQFKLDYSSAPPSDDENHKRT